MIVYDVTDRESFNAVKIWISEVNKLATPGVSKILVGNKNDLNGERRVTYEEGEELAKRLGIKFLESSAKSAFNVHEVFKTMTFEMMEKIPKKSVGRSGAKTAIEVTKGITLNYHDQEVKKSKKCC